MMKKVVLITSVLIAVIICSCALADLSTPQNIHWLAGSSATATWDAVTDANYYKVDVQVTEPSSGGVNPGNLIGETSTGTADTMIDLQQEIQTIVSTYGQEGTRDVEVCFAVTAQNKTDESLTISSERSTYSSRLAYHISTAEATPPDPPTSLVLTNTYDLSFTFTYPTPFTSWSYDYEIRITTPSGTSYSTCYPGTGPELNILGFVKNLYREYQLYGTTVQADARVQIHCGYPLDYSSELGWCTTEYSLYSNQVEYYVESPPAEVDTPDAPTNLVLSSTWDLTYSFDCPSTFTGFSYDYEIRLTDESDKTYTWAYPGMETINIISIADNCYRSNELYGQTVAVDVRMRVNCSYTDSEGLFNSKTTEWSVYSNQLPYSTTKIEKDTPDPPTALTIDNQWNLSFTFNEDPTFSYYGYEYQIRMTDSDQNEFTTSYPGTGNTLNIERFVHRLYEDNKLLGKTAAVDARVSVTCYYQSQYGTTMSNQTEWSDYSNAVEYGERQVRTLTLSPAAPVVYRNNSLALGKTITPVDAYYEKIHWASDHPEILKVDSAGIITGVSAGSAKVTARIDKATCTVEATVYEINSNIGNATDRQEVMDTAGSVIDDICNSEEPDLSNADIGEAKVEDLQDQIREGIKRGDVFRTDMQVSKQDWTHFSKVEDQIRQWPNFGGFAGGFEITVEIYQQDQQGNKHHIANLTQFKKKIGFTVKPDSLPAIPTGHTREYSMIGIHNGVLSNIPIKQNGDGSFSGESDMFSDFILIYQDKPDETTSNNKPTETPSETSNETPSNTPTETTNNTSNETQNNKPTETSNNKPTETPGNKQNETTNNTTNNKTNEHKHSLSAHAKVNPTYGKEGTEAYWSCDTCQKLFADADAKKEISSPVSISKLQPASQIHAFVIRCYLLILDREPDQSGLEYWAEKLSSGVATAAEIINGFVESVEFKGKNLSYGDQVEVLYQVMLNRASDASGKSYWVSMLNGGNPLAAIINGFCNSIEFKGICSEYGITAGSVDAGELKPPKEVPVVDINKIRAFVTRNYRVILGREPDADGLNYWAQRLASGEATAAEIINGFVESIEFRGKNLSYGDQVEVLYQVMLDRGSDAAGKAYWVSMLNGGNPLAAIINGFCNSIEFRGICAEYGITPGSLNVGELKPPKEVRVVDTNKIKGYITRCYRVILGREPDQGGLDYWTGKMASGELEAAAIIDQFVNSIEFKGKQLSDREAVEVLYQAMLGRGSDEAGMTYWLAKLEAGDPFAVIINGFCNSQEFKGICAEYGITPGSVAVASVTTYAKPEEEEETPEQTPEQVPEQEPEQILEQTPAEPAPADERTEQARAFVTHCYQSALLRDPGAEETDYYANQILSGQMTAKDIIHAFAFSQEFQGKWTESTAFVRVLYRLCLDREADADGLVYWTDKLANGETAAAVFNALTENKEFVQVCATYGVPAGVDANAIRAQEEAAAAETEESAAPAAPASEFTNEEKIRAFVSRFYRDAMGREADEEGLNYYTSRILNGEATPKDVAKEIILSDEFRGRMPGNEELVRILYRVYLGREADEEGLANWAGQLDSGVTLETILNGFADSEEFAAVVNGLK